MQDYRPGSVITAVMQTALMLPLAAEQQFFETFIDLIAQGRVGVSWFVKSEFGPDSLESYRQISFLVDGEPIADHPFAQRLENKLIEALSIPPTSKDYFISGEGELQKRGNLIDVDYYWGKSIPYDWPSETDSGTVTLIDLDRE